MVADAVAQAETRTEAEIVAVIVPASDAYSSYILGYGFILGSLIAFAVWWCGWMVAFPLLVAMQMAVIMLASFLPLIRHEFLRLIPTRVLHHRATHRAFEEYLYASRHLYSTTPIVLFYVSLAERYAHVMPCRVVREQIATEVWDRVVDDFTAGMKTGTLGEASTKTIAQLATILAAHFPKYIIS